METARFLQERLRRVAEAKSLQFDLSSGPQGFIKVTFSGNVMYPPVNE